MAGRQGKVGLDYFELDCLLDDNIKLIQAEFGLKGFAVVVKLYQKIYAGNGYYCEWNDDVLLLFMSENLVPSDNRNLISEVVSACIRRNIFSGELYDRFGILTSKGVQKRYLNAVSRRDKVYLIKEYLLISVGENTINVVINSINVDGNSINVCRNTQSRVEKSRVEKSRVEKRRVEKSRVEKRRVEKSKEESTLQESSEDSARDRIDYNRIVDSYNSICTALPKCIKITDSRKRLIRSRLNDYSETDLIAAFEKAQQSDFLSGRSGKWNGANIDWILNATNIQKILEGNYKNRNGGKSSNATSDYVDKWRNA